MEYKVYNNFEEMYEDLRHPKYIKHPVIEHPVVEEKPKEEKPKKKATKKKEDA